MVIFNNFNYSAQWHMPDLLIVDRTEKTVRHGCALTVTLNSVIKKFSDPGSICDLFAKFSGTRNF